MYVCMLYRHVCTDMYVPICKYGTVDMYLAANVLRQLRCVRN